MRVLIIGLGIYGSNLAKDLTSMGHEVIGADRSASIVDSIKELISTAYIVDSTDEAGLSALPLIGVDLVIVAIGENFGASIKTVALLKKLGVKHIYARAADPIHHAILEGMNVDRIITPEQRAARDLSMEMVLGQQTDTLAIAPDLYAVRLGVPDMYVGTLYSKLPLEKDFGVKLIAACRPQVKRNLVGIDTEHLAPLDITDPELKIESGDVMLCYGSRRQFHRLISHSA